MAIEKVKEYFSEYGISDRVREFDVSSATVELAAQALGCEPCRIAKTLSFLVDGKAVLIVAAGDAKGRSGTRTQSRDYAHLKMRNSKEFFGNFGKRNRNRFF